MSDYLHRVQVNWHKTLEKILSQAAKAKRSGLLVFDLDSTVFDNRPRQARIVREFGKKAGFKALESCQAWHFTSGWDLRGAVLACGFTQADADKMYPDLKSFWGKRFFTSKYCEDDIEIVGAPRFLHALDRSKARVIYVTGRHEGMRAGTEACLERCGMPMPSSGGHVRLLMKPELADSDDDYKRTTHDELRKMGTVIAAFDNEPTHINDYAVKFAKATPVHLATDHSGRDVKLHERCVSIPHFAY